MYIVDSQSCKLTHASDFAGTLNQGIGRLSGRFSFTWTSRPLIFSPPRRKPTSSLRYEEIRFTVLQQSNKLYCRTSPTISIGLHSMWSIQAEWREEVKQHFEKIKSEGTCIHRLDEELVNRRREELRYAFVKSTHSHGNNVWLLQETTPY